MESWLDVTIHSIQYD